MTYSLNTLNSPRSSVAPVASGWRRFADELGLLLGLLLLLLWLVALLTYSAQDAAWSTSGSGAPVLNRAGRLGAWLADGSYYVFGFSVWWCVAAAVRTWLAGLARWLRGRDLLSGQAEPATSSNSLIARLASSRTAFWCALALLLCASASLEWSYLYSLEARLPGFDNRSLERRTYSVDGFEPDLQVLTSRALGDGDPTVCELDGVKGGIPAVPDLAFTTELSTIDAMNDLGCRAYHRLPGPGNACTRSTGNALFDLVESTSEVQFCIPIARAWALPAGQTTIFAARLRDTAGTFGPVSEMVVRVDPLP